MHVFAHLGQTACEAQQQACLQQCEQTWLWEDGQPIPVNQPSANYPDYFACVQQCPKCPGSPDIPINQAPPPPPPKPPPPPPPHPEPVPDPSPPPARSGSVVPALLVGVVAVGIFVATVSQ